MSMTIPSSDFATILHIFSQEMTLVISELGGYTLKYVGDAVIAIFPAQFDKQQASKNAVECARLMHDIVKYGINPQLTAHGLPELRIKISMDYGEVQVVLYGKSLERSHIDIIGSSISTAAKMISFSSSGQIVAGQRIFEILQNVVPQDNFVKLAADTSKWSHVNEDQGNYSLYLLKNSQP
jgi:class 3 adenylate cyclase